MVSRKSKKIVILSIAIFVVFSLICFFGISIAHAVVFNRYDYDTYDDKRYITYSDVSEEYPRQEFEILSGDNTLKAYIYGEENSTGLMVISPGHTDSNDIKLYEIMYFVKAGWKVICYDYTGCYTSEGDSMNGYTQSVHDLDAVLKYVENNDKLAQMPTVLFGHSLGAYSSCAVLNYKHNVSAVVATSGFDTPKEQWRYSIERFTGIFHWILKPYTALFTSIKYGDEADLSAIDGINSTNIPVLIASGTNDEFYGGMSPVYEKRGEIVNENCEFILMDEEGKNGHIDYYLTKQAITYQNQVNADSFSGKIDKELYMEHNIGFMDRLNQFYLSALSNSKGD